MARFYPPIDFDSHIVQTMSLGERSEYRVLKAVDSSLDDLWAVFHHIEWRELEKSGEKKGETDIVLFHPEYGILVIEIKGGEIHCCSGQWSQVDAMTGERHDLKLPPFAQARRNYFFLEHRLNKTVLGPEVAADKSLSYTCWFPSVVWKGPMPPDAPDSSFIFDERHLSDPEQHIRKILKEANPHAKPWQDRESDILIKILCPDVHLVPPLRSRLSLLKEMLSAMTSQQLEALRGLREYKRLLVQGCAGSGKTVLAIMLCKEHLQEGKKVLFTCYNKRLAGFVAHEFAGYKGIESLNFHELVRKCREDAGRDFAVPENKEKQKQFFETAHELLLDICPRGGKYDTIVVDEAYDFRPDWWAALEFLGRPDFSYYAFYDDQQNIFTPGNWTPPFQGEPFYLEKNVRNTRPIGEFARKIGHVSRKCQYAVNAGEEPKCISYSSPTDIPILLEKVIKEVVDKGKVSPDDVVVLAPYRIEQERLGIGNYLKSKPHLFSTDLVTSDQGKVRIGTIQAFKGLEADIVILLGIDGSEHACSPANLYVGITRARAMLYVIHQKNCRSLSG